MRLVKKQGANSVSTFPIEIFNDELLPLELKSAFIPGPFGNLIPIQLHNQTGRGFFRCAGEYIPPQQVKGSDEEM